MTPTDPFEELRNVEATLAELTDETAEEYFGMELTRHSLRRQRDELLAEAMGVMELGIKGHTPEITGAEVGLVSRVLGELQETLSSIAQAIQGAPTLRGVVPLDIQQSVQLRVAEAVPGSLQLRLVPVAAPEEPERQPTLPIAAEEEQEPPLIDKTMDRLFDLLSEVEGESDVLQHVADVGPRASLHLQQLSEALSEAGADASIAWRSSHVERSESLTRARAERLAAALQTIDEESRSVTYTGRLAGGSLVRGKFELELAGDEPHTIITGAVPDELLDAVEEFFGQAVTAEVDVHEARLPSGETRESHILRTLTA